MDRRRHPLHLSRPALSAAALVAVAALLCFTRLAAGSLWNDEAFSFFVSWRGLSETLNFVQLDTQPPLYYMILTAWLKLGHSPFVLRSLSAVAMVAAVPLVFASARALFGWRIAILAGILFTLDGNVLEWGQRARPYALQTFFAALAFWGFVRIWTAERQRVGWPGWFAYCIGGAAAVLTQYPVGFMLVGCNLAMAWRIFSQIRSSRGLLVRWIVAQLVLFALCALWLPSFVGQASADLTGTAIAARHTIYLVSFARVIETIGQLVSVPTLYSLRWAFLVLFGVAAALGIRAASARRNGLPILMVLGIALAIWLIGWNVHPIFGYVAASSVWLLIPYSMLLAIGVRSLPCPAGALLMAALCLGDILGLYTAYQIQTVPLDQVAAEIGAELGPRDGVLLSRTQSGRWGLSYYLGEPYRGKLRGLDTVDLTNFTHAPDPGQTVRWLLQQPADADRLDRLWVLTPDHEAPLFDPATALPGATEAFHKQFRGLTLQRYDRPIM